VAASVPETTVSGAGYYLDPELYDAVYSDVVADIAPHVRRLRAAGGPALEVCCGNGRLLLPTLAAGVACDGLDVDANMLASLHRKLAARGLRTSVIQGDMRDFSLPQRYAIIVIPFNSFLHNLTQQDQLATLRCCRHHLAPGGRLVIIAFHPSAEKLLQWTGEEAFLKELPWQDHVRVWDRADDDRVEQIRRMTRRIEFSDAQGQMTRRVEVKFDLRYVYKPEMELLLHVAGFPRWEAHPELADDAGASSIAGNRPLREGDNIAWTAWGH
jgi:SAM-dependent methyltransferase